MANIFNRINPKHRKFILLGILIIFILFAGSRFLSSRPKTSVASQVEVSAPTKKEDINKEFTFPVGEVDGKKVNMKFTVIEASLNNQIVVQGQNATAVKGRTFLIVTLKISNELNQSLQINTRDYVRLSVNGDESTLLAPDIHNDPVEVQAISTKFTRVGFPINTTDKDLILQIGEIKGEKQKIPLNL